MWRHEEASADGEGVPLPVTATAPRVVIGQHAEQYLRVQYQATADGCVVLSPITTWAAANNVRADVADDLRQARAMHRCCVHASCVQTVNAYAMLRLACASSSVELTQPTPIIRLMKRTTFHREDTILKLGPH